MSDGSKKVFEEVFESMRKEAALKQGMTAAFTDLFDGFKRLRNSKVKVDITVEQIRQLEECNHEFAEATQEGFTEDQVREMVVNILDYFIKQLKLERLEKSFALMLFSIKVKKVDLAAITGTAFYEYMLENDLVKQFTDPEFKKKYIAATATELTVEKKNISFNTAVRRVIAKCNSATFVEDEVEKTKPEIDAVCDIINPLVDWYMENEMEIIGMFLKE